MKGKINDIEYDCNYKKGWNITYGWDKIMTTQKPAGVNLKWYFYAFDEN